MNRAIRHDALLLWREFAAALANWGDRLLVAAGLVVIVAAARHAAAAATSPVIEGVALAVAGRIGFEFGRLVERRLAFHRDAYLFAEDIVSRDGAWRYRLGFMTASAAAVAGVSAAVDLRAIVPALAGMILAFLLAGTYERYSVRSGRRVEILGRRRWLPAAGAFLALALATMPLWWPGAPVWAGAIPVLAVATIMAPNDADAVRFEAMIGRPVWASLKQVMPAFAWCVGLALIASFAQGTGAAIGLMAGLAVVWLAALRVMAWRRVGRRSGEFIVLVIVAVSGVAGAMAIVLAPIALMAATGWLWRRSQAATWLIA